MKMTRKLIPALVMLIVSAIMLSTASFAWFANNTSVSATSMTVKANTDVKFLQIKNDDEGSTWGKTAEATNASDTDLKLVHAHIATGKDVTWWEGEADDPGSPDANDDLTPVNEGDISGNYALVNTFYVKMSNADTTLTNLTISGVTITAGSGASNLQPALRVLVVATASDDSVLGAQLWNAATNNRVTDTDIESATALAPTVTGVADQEIKLSVYVFYDGEDASAFTNNTAAVAEQTVSISFSAS